MLKLSHLAVKWNYADRCNLIENRIAIWSELRTQYCGLWTKEFGLQTETCVYFTIGLFIVAGRPSAALEVNGKGKGRIKQRQSQCRWRQGQHSWDWIQKFVYKFQSWNRFTGWITLSLLKWIAQIQYEIHLIDLLILLTNFLI